MDFERQIRKHKDAVYAQMIRVCGNKEDAEDALGTAILIALKSANQLHHEAAFRNWVAMIGRRVCLRMKSNAKMQEALSFAEDHHLVQDSAQEMEMQVMKGCVKDALASLDPGLLEVYQLCGLEQRTVPEAAAALGLTVAATKSRLFRARAQIRELLDRSICSG